MKYGVLVKYLPLNGTIQGHENPVRKPKDDHPNTHILTCRDGERVDVHYATSAKPVLQHLASPTITAKRNTTSL